MKSFKTPILFITFKRLQNMEDKIRKLFPDVKVYNIRDIVMGNLWVSLSINKYSFHTHLSFGLRNYG